MVFEDYDLLGRHDHAVVGSQEVANDVVRVERVAIVGTSLQKSDFDVY